MNIVWFLLGHSLGKAHADEGGESSMGGSLLLDPEVTGPIAVMLMIAFCIVIPLCYFWSSRQTSDAEAKRKAEEALYDAEQAELAAQGFVDIQSIEAEADMICSAIGDEDNLYYFVAHIGTAMTWGFLDSGLHDQPVLWGKAVRDMCGSKKVFELHDTEPSAFLTTSDTVMMWEERNHRRETQTAYWLIDLEGDGVWNLAACWQEAPLTDEVTRSMLNLTDDVSGLLESDLVDIKELPTDWQGDSRDIEKLFKKSWLSTR